MLKRNKLDWAGRQYTQQCILRAAPADALEKFIHTDTDIPPLARAGMIHHQFEASHPFVDGKWDAWFRISQTRNVYRTNPWTAPQWSGII